MCIRDRVLNGIVKTREIASENTSSDIEINGEYHLTGGIITVSYTHLDVYKRQPYEYAV